ncbi:MAG: HD domain-containing protein [Bacteroidales bacterium]|nr:HD domain-containing protein [Bacteroidales bacterium]
MKSKIVNDPVYGFITIPGGVIAEIIDSPCVQRLNRIHQLGFSYLVYPGATHTRLGHTIGAMHLLQQAIHILEHKGVSITPEEKTAALIAIVLHDTGHGPFSHALERQFFTHHEQISKAFFNQLKIKYPSEVSLALEIFNNTYSKPFLHQLISSQLDVDRLDYLTRDSFFTGVSEGVIGTDRIIHMLCLAGQDLAIEEKGIYSIEKFIVARRLMYWQVYYHKTVVSAEKMINSVISRARDLLVSNRNVFASPHLLYFLQSRPFQENIDEEFLLHFTYLDDSDILSALKVWQTDDDPVLSYLAKSMIHRQLFKTQFFKENIPFEWLEKIKNLIRTYFKVQENETNYFMSYGKIENNAYNSFQDKIWILMNSGEKADIAEVSEQMNKFIKEYTSVKYYLTLPKEIWKFLT